MNNLTPVIANITIRQDKQGRFNLVDLHKASGGATRHSPSYWLRNQQTQEFITELRNSLILSDSGNPETDSVHIEPVNIVKSFFMDQGTYVVEELVYPYAMWVSPAFHLKVIRAYAALVKNGVQVPEAKPAAMEQRMDRIVSLPIKSLSE
ncbi:MAG: KilA-N domain-containing protein [Methylobacter sp.]|nr:KilA-N domain-containing protein [Methylobacter sp.]MDZ4201761.1 KilA-N domain-containing protein [Gallionella sp.]MDP2099913.1 KilA-N domain-containing protein [Methylobacter sp.]MDP2427771.1 KilA-N domain-containing protein [Methylobacter sp.]MDP3054151.1 KilA-N domain-containing protein [Methylobacter sp.]